jgi:hypothetical protein
MFSEEPHILHQSCSICCLHELGHISNAHSLNNNRSSFQVSAVIAVRKELFDVKKLRVMIIIEYIVNIVFYALINKVFKHRLNLIKLELTRSAKAQ